MQRLSHTTAPLSARAVKKCVITSWSEKEGVMSSSAVSIPPLGAKKKDGKRKRRPNFRPTPKTKQKQRVAPPTTSEIVPDDFSQETANFTTAGDPLLSEQSLETQPQEAAAQEGVAHLNYVQPAFAPVTTTKKRGRRRKSTGVAVGVTRNFESSTALETHTVETTQLPASSIPEVTRTQLNDVVEIGTAEETAEIPEDESGLPSLKAICEIKPKKRKGSKPKTPTAAPLPVAPETEEPVTAGPTVRIVDGEIVLQKSSMIVNASSKEVEKYPVVEEEAQLAVVGASYNSFVNRKGPQHWTPEETERFYEALRQIGTDFSTMEAYFGSKRTRRQLKRKYQTELARFPLLVEAALDPKSRKEIGKSMSSCLFLLSTSNFLTVCSVFL